MRLISGCTLLILLVMASAASAQGWQPPSDSQRCPSKWGKGDQRGSGNHMKPESVLKAARPNDQTSDSGRFCRFCRSVVAPLRLAPAPCPQRRASRP